MNIQVQIDYYLSVETKITSRMILLLFTGVKIIKSKKLSKLRM